LSEGTGSVTQRCAVAAWMLSLQSRLCCPLQATLTTHTTESCATTLY